MPDNRPPDRPEDDPAAGEGPSGPAPGVTPLRAVWFAFGLLFVLLAFIGALLPVIPTVPFLILAAACFSRSSRRFENWLLYHRHFGPLLRDWRARGAIPRRAKYLALAGTGVGFTIFVAGAQPGLPLALAVAVVMLSGLAYVFTRPS